MEAADPRYLSTARQAAQADAGRLVLTHQWPGTHPAQYLDAAAKEYDGRTCLALRGLSFDA